MTRSLQEDEGAAAVEYALLLAVVFVVISGAVTLFGQNVQALFQAIPPGLF